jgi:GDP-L-fucose synthase
MNFVNNIDSPCITMNGTGTTQREYIHCEDAANGIKFLLESNHNGIYNIGTNKSHSIRDVVDIIKECSGFCGEIKWDSTFPDGVKYRQIDSSLINALGWKSSIGIKSGLERTFTWAKQQKHI